MADRPKRDCRRILSEDDMKLLLEGEERLVTYNYSDLIDLCRPVTGSRSSGSLRSSERGLLSVPFARRPTTIIQSRAGSVVAPIAWNGLPPVPCLLSRTLSDSYNSFNE